MKTSMKSILLAGLVLGALALGVVTPSTAHAQQLATVDIPFSFQIGHTLLPAGPYSISHGPFKTIQVRRIDGSEAAFVITTLADKTNRQGRANISFNRYGNHYFLLQVEVSDNRDAYRCPKTRQEETLAHLLNVKNATQVALNLESPSTIQGN